MKNLSDFVVSVAGPMAGYVSFASGNFDTLVNNQFKWFIICLNSMDTYVLFYFQQPAWSSAVKPTRP